MTSPEGNDKPEASDETTEAADGRHGIGRRLREAVGGGGEMVTGTADTVTGVQFRRQFEDFTDTVTTTVVGMHRDQAKLGEHQAELRERLNALEAAYKPSDPTPLLAELQERLDLLERAEVAGKIGGTPSLAIVFSVVAALALALSVVAVVRTF